MEAGWLPSLSGFPMAGTAATEAEMYSQFGFVPQGIKIDTTLVHVEASVGAPDPTTPISPAAGLEERMEV